MTIKQITFITLILSFCCVLFPETNHEKVELKAKKPHTIKIGNNFKKEVARKQENAENWFTYYEEDSHHGYPPLPSDFCNCDKEKFVEAYRDAINRDVNSTSWHGRTGIS